MTRPSGILGRSRKTAAARGDFVLTLRNTVAGGRGTGAATVLGVGAASFLQVTLASVGLGTLIVQSQPAFATLKWLGIGYLVSWLQCRCDLRGLVATSQPGSRPSRGTGPEGYGRDSCVRSPTRSCSSSTSRCCPSSSVKCPCLVVARPRLDDAPHRNRLATRRRSPRGRGARAAASPCGSTPHRHHLGPRARRVRRTSRAATRMTEGTATRKPIPQRG